jgi:hypothetical protein
VTLGGEKANGLTRYFNDFSFALSREGTTSFSYVNGGVRTGNAPTSNPGMATFDFFPVSTWASSVGSSGFGYKDGYAVISIVQDVNGTRGLEVYGWNGRDTYWAGAWASVYLNKADVAGPWMQPGTVAMIIHITYGPGTWNGQSSTGTEPLKFTVVKTLGTITEFGSSDFATSFAPNPFDLFPTYAWNGESTVPSLSNAPVWWYQKLPTVMADSVQFDP